MAKFLSDIPEKTPPGENWAAVLRVWDNLVRTTDPNDQWVMCNSQLPQSYSESNAINGATESVPYETVHDAEAPQPLHNSCLLIAELPNELLLEIIHLSLYGLEWEYFIRPRECVQVSTSWYNLVKHSPILWGSSFQEDSGCRCN
ncbi:hypothetical protein FRB94_014208 [Tulasnella sp. JGI-2019a]|nr:hypothetical protein FRB93_005445 [Tulasnella sp. JGI-2019a]KAG9014116.1 hypothetical protein FRB94_014208 [Tulasnella sp. JGI-2019a]KAG9028802.1 hypothetical protein FRB95_006082 [Tulasnella sp. JGI-2019a]